MTFKKPRVVRSKGYRSKGPAADGGVSSYTFNNVDLRAVDVSDLDLRGSTRLTPPPLPAFMAARWPNARQVKS